MNSFFKELFEYSHHYNQQLWYIFNEKAEQTSEKSIMLFNHLLNAHQIWNNRVNPTQTTFGVWDIHPIEDCRSIDKVNFERSLFILKNLDLNKIISYTNTKGQDFSNSIRDILFHIINHSTYHRGQIATELKQSGFEPLITDFIFYKR